MAATFIGAGTVGLKNNPTVTVPTGYAAGDLLVIFITSSVTPTTPTGWTLKTSFTTSPQYYIYTKTATSSESSVTITANVTTAAAVMTCYRNVNTSSFDAISTAKNSASTISLSTNTLTTTAANDLILNIYFTTGVNGSWVAPLGTNVEVSTISTNLDRNILIVDELQASIGTSTARTGTFSATVGMSCVQIALLDATTTVTSGNFFRLF